MWKSRLVKVGLFFIMVWVIFLSLDYFITDKLSTVQTKQNWILNLTNKSVDYIVIGSSKSEQGADVTTIYKNSKLDGLNLSCSGCGIAEQFLLLNEFLQKNYTKNVLLMVDFTTFDPNQFTYPFHDYLYFHRFGDTDVSNVIFDQTNVKKFLIWKYIPFVRYAEFNSEFKRLIYNEIKLEIDNRGFSNPKKTKVINSQRTNSFDNQSNGIQKYDEINRMKIDDQAKNYLNKIINLCETKKIKLILASFPEYTKGSPNFEIKVRNPLRNLVRLIALENNLKYLDLTELELCQNKNNFNNDGVHLNLTGLTLLTPILENLLLKNFEINQ
jgi:hypothetical protein